MIDNTVMSDLNLPPSQIPYHMTFDTFSLHRAFMLISILLTLIFMVIAKLNSKK